MRTLMNNRTTAVAALLSCLLSRQSTLLVVDAQSFESCSICPQSSPSLGLPLLTLPSGIAGLELPAGSTCGQLQEATQAGTYSRAVCAIIRLVLAETCGCFAPTDPVTASPATTTLAPTVVSATSAPTIAPVTSAPTIAPVTSAPTIAPVTSAPTIAPISGVTTAPVITTPTLAPVNTTTITSAPTTAPVPGINPTAAPVSLSPVAAPVAVTTVAPAVGAGPVSTGAPVGVPIPVEADSDNELSPGGIAGITIAAVLAALLIALIVYRLSKNDDEGPNNRVLLPEEKEVEEEVDNDEESIMLHPPPNPLVIPPDAPRASVASRAAVQAAASGAGSVLSMTPSVSEHGESEMEGYSMNAPGSTAENPGSTDVASAASGALSSLRHNMIARTVMIPPGKLGIVVDTTLEGPVVNKVNDGSPVTGLLFPGDIVVAVDDVDTRAMSASAIYSLMKKTSSERRQITVLSEDLSA